MPGFLAQVEWEEEKKSVSFTVHLYLIQSYSFRGAPKSNYSRVYSCLETINC